MVCEVSGEGLFFLEFLDNVFGGGFAVECEGGGGVFNNCVGVVRDSISPFHCVDPSLSE